ncbi:NAD(P)/FAD-dependent oxidoreductase [Stygiolobus caldivivus]|uniref:FAD-dependent oxidoreductase n=1 Tax=Stygiolobus caldivivus TaxID=2824673 RepID=A0A8D5U7I0_9CREN|nr:FAD-binding oxidoreductase [Stygiolobus caldivivus]BCU70388.1 FAD-dependent oxidoreductase [Stygiolobus caldivivus]
MIIVGAGSHGLSLAYHLVKKGFDKDIKIVEMRRIGFGSSSRNASRFRYHFNSRENINYAKKAIPYLLSHANELKLNPLLYFTGYLWVLRDEKQISMLKKLHNRWSSEGIGGKFVECEEFGFIKYDGLCYYAPQDGAFHHDYILYSYYIEVKGKAEIIIDEAKRIVFKGERVKGVELAHGGVLEDNEVVVTAGAWTGKLLENSGIKLPIYPEKKEIFITEDISFRVKPLVIDTLNKVYFSQTLKGEIIGGTETPIPYGFLPFTNSLAELSHFLRAVRETIKGAEGIGILRGWSGYYEMTPDSSHIMGYDEEWPEGLYVNAGYSGHGMMFAPYSGKIMAELILDGVMREEMRPYLPNRFRTNKLIEENLVI